MVLRAVRWLVVAGLVVGAGVGPGNAAMAVDLDPFPTREPTVTVLGASSAGVLYRLNPIDYMTPAVNWVKPTGGPAYQVPGEMTQLAGSWVFGLEGDTYEVPYQQIGTPVTHVCIQEHAAASATSFGWVTGGGARVEVSAADCAVTARLPVQGGIAAADDSGYVDLRSLPGFEGERLTYYSYSDPTHPREINDAGYKTEIEGVHLQGTSVTWTSLDRDAAKTPRIVRAQTDGSPANLLTKLTDGGNPRTTIAGSSTGWATCDNYEANCRAGSIEANGTQHRLNGSRSVVSDGTRFIFDTHTTAYAVDAAAAVDATTPRTRIADVVYLPPVAQGVSLGAGGVAYADSQAPGQAISQRAYSQSGKTITVSGQTRVADGGLTSVRDGRRTAYTDAGGDLWIFRDDGVRTKVFDAAERVAIVGDGGLHLSGSRLLWWKASYTGDVCDPASCFPDYNTVVPMIYNLATGVSSQVTGPVHYRPATIWGSYLAYADASQAIWRRDLSSGTLLQVKPPGGSPINDVAVNDDYVAWSICQPDCNPSMVTYRNMATKAAAVQILTNNTTSISLSGGHVLFGTTEGPYGKESILKVLRLGTKATGVVGPYRKDSNYSVHDETLGWVGTDGVARISPNSSFVAPPRFLGLAIGSTSFSPAAGSWVPEFSISKALPTCNLTIRSGTTVRRVLTCPTTVGSARPGWNGLDSAGHLVPKGTYTWTLTGSDSDGPLRWWTNATHPISGTIKVV